MHAVFSLWQFAGFSAHVFGEDGMQGCLRSQIKDRLSSAFLLTYKCICSARSQARVCYFQIKAEFA